MFSPAPPVMKYTATFTQMLMTYTCSDAASGSASPLINNRMA